MENIYSAVNRKDEITHEIKGKMRDTHVSMFFGDKINANRYGYYYFPFLNSINSYEEDFTRVLGVNEINQPNYAVFFLGGGRIYLHVAPRIFSNYFLLSGDNYQYFENVISYLRLNPGKIYWDEYYKNSSPSQKRNNYGNNNDGKDFSSLQVIRQNPPLLWAFCLTVTGMLLFVLFKVKRKQRVINEIKPNSNVTVAFTETIGRLYLQHKNNRRIADKIITYFYENIRNKYFINTTTIDDNFINSLAGKSGVAVDEVNLLFALVENMQSQENVTDEQLLSLNSKIDNFNKNKT